MENDFNFLLSMLDKHAIKHVYQMYPHILRLCIFTNIGNQECFTELVITYNDETYSIVREDYPITNKNIREIAAFILNAYRNYGNIISNKTVCVSCNKEIDSENIFILKGFHKKEALGTVGEVQICEAELCNKCFAALMFEISR